MISKGGRAVSGSIEFGAANLQATDELAQRRVVKCKSDAEGAEGCRCMERYTVVQLGDDEVVVSTGDEEDVGRAGTRFGRCKTRACGKDEDVGDELLGELTEDAAFSVRRHCEKRGVRGGSGMCTR